MLLAEGKIVFRMFNVNLEVGEAEDQIPNHNTAIAGKSSMVGEVGGIRSNPPNVLGLMKLWTWLMPMNLLWSANIAMVVTLEQMDVGGVSLGSVFNEDLFQSQEFTSQALRLWMMTKPYLLETSI